MFAFFLIVDRDVSECSRFSNVKVILKTFFFYSIMYRLFLELFGKLKVFIVPLYVLSQWLGVSGL